MRRPIVTCASLVIAAAGGAASPASAQPQKVSPPEAQAWIDIATFAGMGVPGMGMGMPGMGAAGPGSTGGGSAGMGGMLGSLFGGGGAGGATGNRFGNTSTGTSGRWMDVTLTVRRQPALASARMAVPQGSGLAPSLALQAPQAVPGTPPDPGDDRVVEERRERPRGKVSLYWGCGDSVRAGQPRTVDFSTAVPADLMQVFNGRRATQRGAHNAPGRPVWPSEQDSRMLPGNASLVGEHAFSAAGLPEGFRFSLPAAQDLMPALDLKQADAAGATRLSWIALPTARGYFVAAMGARRGDENHLVIWTSSELPDSGFGLVDYQTNAAVDRWLGEQVLLARSTTTCTVPRGVFEGGAAMLRAIAFGTELNLAHPPRPADPKVPWEPQWAVKVRVKSVANAMLGMEMPGGDVSGGLPVQVPAGAAAPADPPPPAPAAPPAATAPQRAEPKEERPGIPGIPGLPGFRPMDALRGIFGR